MSIGYSNKYDSSGNALQRKWTPGEVLTTVGRWDFTAALTSATNTTNTYYKGYLVPLPPYARVVDIKISTTNIDIGGNTMTFNIGDAGDATRYFSACTIGQTGASPRHADISNTTAVTITTSSGKQNKGIGYTYTANDDIIFQVQTAPGTSATTGSIQAIVTYYCGEVQE